MADIEKEGKNGSINAIDRLQKRFQSAGGQQQSVIGEVFEYLKHLIEKQDSLERRIARLESK